MDNKTLIQNFYTAFQKGDADAMIACYHQDVEFIDRAFGTLKGARAGAMWKMLCSRSTDLKIEFSHIEADGDKGKAHWEAWYTFSQTGKKVHNIIEAEFEFKDGKIYRHIDYFSLWRWSSQAMGMIGKLVGWTAFFKAKLQTTTNEMLDKYIAKNA